MKHRHRRSGLVVGILGLLLAVTAKADARSSPYVEMLEGHGVEVCEACLKAFETVASEAGAVGLSGCERNYASEYGLSAPQWTELPPLKHLSLLKKVMMFLIPVDTELYVGRGLAPLEGTIYENDDTFKREIKTELKYERIAIAQTMVDIDNDGHPEPLFTYRRGYCTNPQASAPSRAIVVLTQNRKSIDPTKTDLMMQNELKESGRPAGNDSSKMYDIFFFKKQTYFDKWDRNRDPVVTVYQAKGKRVTSLCKFLYEIRPQSFGGNP